MPQDEEDLQDKVGHDEDLENDETSPEDARQRGGLEAQDDTGIPRPSEDGDPDADADERQAVGGNHDAG